MGRPRKTLLERVLDNSFRPGRYGFLLGVEDLPGRAPFDDRRRRLIWAHLRELQQDYRAAEGDEAFDADWHRGLIAATFSSYVCGLHGQLASWLSLEEPKQRGSKKEIDAILGPPEYVFSVKLRCEECGWESDDEALGWVALLGYDPCEDDFATAVVYCPDCAEHEFELKSRRDVSAE